MFVLVIMGVASCSNCWTLQSPKITISPLGWGNSGTGILTNFFQVKYLLTVKKDIPRSKYTAELVS